jgi:hypothetical protein
MQRLVDSCTAERIGRALAWFLLMAVIVVASVVAAHGEARDTARDASRAGTTAAQRVAAIQLRNGCGRTQLQRAYLQLRASENLKRDTSTVSRHAQWLFAIVWCERTYKAGYVGSPVYLPKRDAACFMYLMTVGYWDHRQPFTDPRRLRPLCVTS